MKFDFQIDYPRPDPPQVLPVYGDRAGNLGGYVPRLASLLQYQNSWRTP